MKIAFYSDTVFTFGGVQRVLAEIAKGLSAQHEVTILTLDGTFDTRMYDYDRSRVRFVRLAYPPCHGLTAKMRRGYGLLYKHLLPHTGAQSSRYARTFFPEPYKRILTAAIREGEYDVVVGVHAYLTMHLASIRPRIPGRVIGWMHNSYEAFFEKEDPYLPYLKDFFRYCLKRIDDCVVLSQADAKRYREELGIDPTVIYNPLTVEPLAVDLTHPAVHHRILSVGRFAARHKGFDILLKAFAPFARRHPEWQLELVGEGPEQSLYEQIIREEKMERQVVISPFTTRVQAHYAAADFYVLSSRWEGLPLVLMEAMAHGLPVVASDLPIVKELFEGKDVALRFPSENVEALTTCLERMVEDSHWLGMRVPAKEYAARFMLPQILKEWEELLDVKY